MTRDEFEARLARNREAAIRLWAEAWYDANNGSRSATIGSLAALATHAGVPRIELGDDVDLVNSYVELTGGDDEDEDEDEDDEATV